jgi:hypothetical protein
VGGYAAHAFKPTSLSALAQSSSHAGRETWLHKDTGNTFQMSKLAGETDQQFPILLLIDN